MPHLSHDATVNLPHLTDGPEVLVTGRIILDPSRVAAQIVSGSRRSRLGSAVAGSGAGGGDDGVGAETGQQTQDQAVG